MCELIFGKKKVNMHVIFQQSLKATLDYANWKKDKTGENLHKTFYRHFISIMCDASRINNSSLCGSSYIIVADNQCIVQAGVASSTQETSLHAELAALEEALKQCRERSLNPNQIFSDCLAMLELIQRNQPRLNGRFQDGVWNIKNLLNHNPEMVLEYIPCELNSVADVLANFGRKIKPDNHPISQRPQ